MAKSISKEIKDKILEKVKKEEKVTNLIKKYRLD